MSVDKKAGLYYGVQDPNITDFRVLQNFDTRTGNLPTRQALFVSEDTGEGSTTSPVAFELARRGWGITAIVRGPSQEIYSSEASFKDVGNFDPDTSLYRMRSQAVIAGGSVVSAMQAVATAWGNERGALTMGMGDYPGDHVDTRSEGFKANTLTVPKVMTAMDDNTKGYELRRFATLGLPEDVAPKFLVSGQTNLDAFASFNKEEAKERVRREQGISGVDIYTWFGSKGFSTVESLKIMRDALLDANPNYGQWVLGVRLHPGDRENIDSGAYFKALHPIARRVVSLMRPQVPDLLDAIAASNFVLQERSTTALQATAADIPVGSIVNPFLVERSTIPASLWVPTNSDRTSPSSHNLEETRTMIERFDKDDTYKAELKSRRANYRQDGRAYLRVADYIEANAS